MNFPVFNVRSDLAMKRYALALVAACATYALATGPALAQPKPIRIGVPTAIQLQVGRDTQDAIKMAIDEINAKGGVLGRKLEMVVADETENPETGISAIKKLTADEKVDVLIGGYTSGVTLAQLPHISARQDDLPRRRRGLARDPAPRSRTTTTTTSTSSASARSTPRIRRAQLDGFHLRHSSRASWAISKIAIVGENAKWVQDLVPLLKKGATEAGADVRADRVLRRPDVRLLAAVLQGQGQRARST